CWSALTLLGYVADGSQIPGRRRGQMTDYRPNTKWERKMKHGMLTAALLAGVSFVGTPTLGGQVSGAGSGPDIPISHRDRVYSAEQFSNTLSVTDPVDNKLLGAIHLGDPLPASFSPLYRGQLLVHGLGFSPDHRTLAVVAIGSNAINFIDTATNMVTHIS